MRALLSRFFVTLTVLVLLLVVWWSLTYLLMPAALIGQSVAENSRDVAADLQTLGSWFVPEALRAATLFEWLPYTALAWLTLGAVSVSLSLHLRGATCAPLVVLAVAAIAAATSQAFGLSTTAWLAIAVIACVAGLVCWVLTRGAAFRAQGSATVRWVPVFLIWALWFLLMGIGVIWLADLAARGPGSLRYIGIRQWDAMWLAVFVVAPLTAWGSHKFLGLIVQTTALWETKRGPVVLVGAFALMHVALVWLGASASMGGQRGYPHISSEIVRLLCAVAVAWLMARHYEWGASTARSSGSIALVFVVIAACVAVLVMTKDLGPVLALSVALIPVGVVALYPTALTAKTGRNLAIAILVWLILAFAIHHFLVDWLPAQSWAPERLVLRVEALTNPSSARLDYASQIAWLLNAAGFFGFGLGSVPWCGARAFVGMGSCTKSSGVPVQFGSDYVHTAVAAVWGVPGALTFLLLTLVLLASVVWTVSRHTKVTGISLSVARLHAWMVVVFAAMLLGQLLVSVSGNLGLLPLSGVTQPFLGLGTAALLGTALWIGLALGAIQTGKGQIGWLSSSLNRYFLGVVVGMALFLAGAAIWRAVSDKPVHDRLTPQVVVEGLALLSAQLQSDEQPDSDAVQRASIFASPGQGGCQVGEEQLDRLLERLSGHIGQHVTAGHLSCAEAKSVSAAAKWALSRSSSEAARQVVKPLPGQIGATNPFRLSGCTYLSGGEIPDSPSSPHAAPCTPQAEVTQQLLRSSPLLRQALNVVTSSVRKDPDQHSRLHQYPAQTRSLMSLQVPAWASELNLDRAILLPFAEREPSPTAIGHGTSVTLSIDLIQQSAAQALVECFVGPCEQLSSSQTQGQLMLEGARARMAAVLVVDVKTGQVDAAASAHTPCYEAHNSGKALDNCPALPQPSASRPWKVTNQALHGEAMCGSLCKVPQALALLRSSSPLTQSATSFAKAIRESQTERFIDEFMCVDRAFDAGCTGRRLQALAQATRDLGGSVACEPDDRSCRTMNLFAGLDGAELTALRMKILTDPKDRSQSLLLPFAPSSKTFSPEAVDTCHADGYAKRWRGCKSEGLVAHVAELFGQGNATTSPAGVAQTLVHLANATARQLPAQAPSLSLVEGAPQRKDKQDSNRIAPAHAQQLLQALLEPLKAGGTAHSSCRNAINGDDLMNCNNTGRWVVASKTGTPLFPHDALTLQQREAKCEKVRNQPDSAARRHQWTHCVVPPTKWYALLLGRNNGTETVWTKAVIVLSERNWSAKTGLIDSPFDRGGSVAAEIGLRMARNLAEASEKLSYPNPEHAHGQTP